MVQWNLSLAMTAMAFMEATEKMLTFSIEHKGKLQHRPMGLSCKTFFSEFLQACQSPFFFRPEEGYPNPLSYCKTHFGRVFLS